MQQSPIRYRARDVIVRSAVGRNLLQRVIEYGAAVAVFVFGVVRIAEGAGWL